ncbi:MAG: hypothetical protein GX640_12235 [Fibrobacter sp.]|nr:hypothetical protein [Fibrobacter sp.]
MRYKLLLIFSFCISLLNAEQTSKEILIPEKIGFGWTLEDSKGTVTTRITKKTKLTGIDCYRIEWSSPEIGNYQSEFWIWKVDGIYLIGKETFGQTISFTEPVCILKFDLHPGKAWHGTMQASNVLVNLLFKVTGKELLKTQIGEINAWVLEVTMQGMVIKRWYAAGYGLVKEETFRLVNGQRSILNSKIIISTHTSLSKIKDWTIFDFFIPPQLLPGNWSAEKDLVVDFETKQSIPSGVFSISDSTLKTVLAFLKGMGNPASAANYSYTYVSKEGQTETYDVKIVQFNTPHIPDSLIILKKKGLKEGNLTKINLGDESYLAEKPYPYLFMKIGNIHFSIMGLNGASQIKSLTYAYEKILKDGQQN